MTTPSEFAGLVLIVAAAVPALSPRVPTGVLTTLGLFALALAGITYATGTGMETRQWLLLAGVLVVGVGELVAWHKGLRWRWIDGLAGHQRPARSRVWRD